MLNCVLQTRDVLLASQQGLQDPGLKGLTSLTSAYVSSAWSSARMGVRAPGRTLGLGKDLHEVRQSGTPASRMRPEISTSSKLLPSVVTRATTKSSERPPALLSAG